MEQTGPSSTWSAVYKSMVNRNLGLFSEERQQRIKDSCVALCGLGGVGGPISEILCRLGVGSFKLLDHGAFEPTNTNRQIFCFTDTDGRMKTDVTEEYLRKINPEVKTEKYVEITEENVEPFLEGVDVAVLSIDSAIPCLILGRATRRRGIPLVEGWAGVFGNVRVFTSDTPSLEEVYGFPTVGREISSISEEEAGLLMVQSLRATVAQIPEVGAYYKDSDWQRLQEKNEGTTLCPCVWLTCVLMANETMKILLDWGKLALAPTFAVYDPFAHQVPAQRAPGDEDPEHG